MEHRHCRGSNIGAAKRDAEEGLQFEDDLARDRRGVRGHSAGWQQAEIIDFCA